MCPRNRNLVGLARFVIATAGGSTLAICCGLSTTPAHVATIRERGGMEMTPVAWLEPIARQHDKGQGQCVLTDEQAACVEIISSAGPSCGPWLEDRPKQSALTTVGQRGQRVM